MANLPDYVKDMAERTPVEDFMLDLFRSKFPTGVEVNSLIAEGQTFPLVMARRIPGVGEAVGDPRFIDAATVAIHCFVEDPDGDEDAALLSEACRVILRDALLKSEVVPGRGHITSMEVINAPRRVTDWATAAGPVQYADLPTGVYRYEAIYHLTIRRPVSRP